MKLLAAVSLVALALVGIVPAASAQSTNTPSTQSTNTASSQSNPDQKDHVEFGVFFDYYRLQFAKLNMYGVGGRAGVHLFNSFSVEGEVSYDFQRSTTQNVISFGTPTTETSNVRLIHVLAGPKYELGKGRLRFFVVAKAGLLHFGVGGPVTTGTAINQIANIRDGVRKVVYYPGGGIEFKFWKLGFRVEAGDEIFVDNGANHNVKAAAGPVIRF